MSSDQPRSRPYKGKSPQERIRDRERRFLDTGLELFATQGYASTSVQHICTAARLSRRDYYTLYSSKESLLVAILNEILEGAIAEMRRPMPTDTDLERAIAEPGYIAILDPLRRVHAGIRDVLTYYFTDPRRARLKCVEVLGVSAEVERVRDSWQREFVRVVDDLLALMVAVGLAEPRVFRITSTALLGAYDSLVLLIATDPTDQETFNAMVDEITDFTLKAVGFINAVER